MKTFIFVNWLILLQFCFLPVALANTSTSSVAPRSKLGFELGADYWSSYYFRGMYVYGPGRSVLFPWISKKFGKLTIKATGEIPTEALGVMNSVEKKYLGANVGTTFTESLYEDRLLFSAQVRYSWFPRSENFMDGFLTLSLPKVRLSPTIIYTHRYYLNDLGGVRYQARTFYLRSMIGDRIELSKATHLNLTAAASYYHFNTYKTVKISGISGVTVSPSCFRKL